MAYEKVTDLSTDTVYKLGGVDSKTNKKNPISIEGFYLGSRTVKSENGDSTIHVFQTPRGNEGIWGSADTNSKLSTVPLGTMTNVVFKAKVKIGGGKTKNTFDVFVDKDQSIPVNGQGFVRGDSASTYEADDNSNNYGAESDYDANDAYVNDGAGDTSAAEVAAAADRRAKTQSLLSKKR